MSNPKGYNQSKGAVGHEVSQGGTTQQGLTTRTEAPTNAGTYSALSEQLKPTKLSEKELDFVTLLDMHWGMYGNIPSADKAEELYSIKPATFRQLLSKPHVRTAIEERGITFRSDTDKWRQRALTPLQLLVANSMIDIIDQRSDKKKLQDLGVDTKTYNAWLRDPVFRDYLATRAESMIEGHEHEIYLALIDKIRSGDIKAIQFWYAVTGRFDNAKPTPDVINLPALLTRILEIILDEVDSPEIRSRISDKLMGLGQANALSTQLIEGAQQPPEIEPAKPMPDDLRLMLATGKGVNI
jgi:hypothetical protein